MSTLTPPAGFQALTPRDDGAFDGPLGLTVAFYGAGWGLGPANSTTGLLTFSRFAYPTHAGALAAIDSFAVWLAQAGGKLAYSPNGRSPRLRKLGKYGPYKFEPWNLVVARTITTDPFAGFIRPGGVDAEQSWTVEVSGLAVLRAFLNHVSRQAVAL